MADNSLDDFFAKKDKSKKKKTKFTPRGPSDILPKQESASTVSPAQTQEKKKKEKTQKSEKSDSQQNAASEPKEPDAEWVDFELEKEADYSGLKIQQLTVKDEGDEDSRESNGEEENEDGEGREKKDTSGPWRKQQASASASVAAPEPEPVKEEPAPAAEPASKPVGKYVPPSMRHGAAQSSLDGIGRSSVNNPLRRGGKKSAPNLKSEEDFPTLGSNEPTSDGGALFEKVRSGGKQVEDTSGKVMKLQLGNKYDALQSGAD